LTNNGISSKILGHLTAGLSTGEARHKSMKSRELKHRKRTGSTDDSTSHTSEAPTKAASVALDSVKVIALENIIPQNSIGSSLITSVCDKRDRSTCDTNSTSKDALQ
jgi:hypothetical protein